MTETLARIPGRTTAPPRRHLAMECRAPFEYLAFLAGRRVVHRLRRGDGHPVLVLPGFIGDDQSTKPLRQALRADGLFVHGWEQGRNLGPRAEVIEGVQARLAAIADRHGRTVSLVGYSMGGVIARAIARECAPLVRDLVTLSAPFRFRPGDGSSVLDIYDRISARLPKARIDFSDIPELEEEHLREPLTVPVTSIYSRSDGMIRSRLCLEAEGPRRENVAVVGSHIGMPWNAAALYVVMDRLSQPEGSWRPFQRPAGTGHFYPPAPWWSAREVVGA